MLSSSISYPLLFVAKCADPPPREAAEKYLSPALLRFAREHPIKRNAVLWSRLILLSVPYQMFPDDPPLMIVNDDFSDELTLGGDCYRYCKFANQGPRVAVAISDLPVYLSFKSFDAVNDQIIEIERLRFPAIINDWIERQENSELAFYQYWTLSECLKSRDNPTVRIEIDDDDFLTVRGSSLLVRETFQFWITPNWISTVQGPALTTLLTEVRTPEKTLQLLDEAYERFGND